MDHTNVINAGLHLIVRSCSKYANASDQHKELLQCNNCVENNRSLELKNGINQCVSNCVRDKIHPTCLINSSYKACLRCRKKTVQLCVYFRTN